jgi:cytochrome c5
MSPILKFTSYKNAHFKTYTASLFVALLLIGLVACAPTGKEFRATSASLNYQLRPWATPNRLNEGRTLFQSSCAGCHALPAPTNYPASNWPKIIDDMTPRAGLDTTQASKVLDWILIGDSLPNLSNSAQEGAIQ